MNSSAGIRLIFRKYIKMFMQGVVLPLFYCLHRWKPIDPRLVIFADSHHDSLPFSMERMRDEMRARGFTIMECVSDYQARGAISAFRSMTAFMRYYARARYVFICDYFLPAAACRKKKGTEVIQLWHSGGLMKKFGYDAAEDIPPGYRPDPFRNYDLVTVSADCCVPVFEKAMGKPPGVVRATGISRSDFYFDEKWLAGCRERFRREHPQAAGKKVILWAPTFRGNAASPKLCGAEAVVRLQESLGSGCAVLIRVHPHLEKEQGLSNSPMPTEQLLACADLLITDYSSVLYDYLIFEKPFVLFAPDYEAYQRNRGFYIDYGSLPGEVVTDGGRLADAVLSALREPRRAELSAARRFHMGACDGHATERIAGMLTAGEEAKRGDAGRW